MEHCRAASRIPNAKANNLAIYLIIRGDLSAFGFMLVTAMYCLLCILGLLNCRIVRQLIVHPAAYLC